MTGTSVAVTDSGRIARLHALAFALTSSHELKDARFLGYSNIVGFSPCNISGTKRYFTVKGLMRMNSSRSVASIFIICSTKGDRVDIISIILFQIGRAHV